MRWALSPQANSELTFELVARIRLTNRKILASVKSMRSLQGPTHVLETYQLVRLRVVVCWVLSEYSACGSLCLCPALCIVI